MALTSTFTTISAGQTDANSVLDEVLMDAIRQDIDVLYEWMGGPTYTPSTSHDHNGVNSKKVDVLASLSSAIIGSYVENYTIKSSTLIGDPGTAYTQIMEFYIPRSGTYTIRSGVREENSAYNVVIKIYRNGSAVGTENNPGAVTTWGWWNENIAASSGDVIQLYAHRGASTAERADMAMAIMSGNPYTASPRSTDVEELSLLGSAGSTAYWVYSP